MRRRFSNFRSFCRQKWSHSKHLLTFWQAIFFKFSSDGIEVDKSCYSHRSFVIHLSASMYAPVLSLRVRHITYNASPTRQTCVFVLMIPLIILQSRWRNVYNTWSTEYIRSFTKIIEVLVTVSNDRISWVFECSLVAVSSSLPKKIQVEL